MGLTSGTKDAGLYLWTPNNNSTLCATTVTLGEPAGTGGASGKLTAAGSLGLSQNPEVSGIVSTFNDFSSSKYYYIVVGNTCIKNAYYEVVANGQELVSELNENISNKANNDLSVTEVSQAFIDKAISWLMPNYSSATAVTETEFVAPLDGWILGTVDGGRTTLNGLLLFENASGSTFIQVPMKKDDVFLTTGTIVTLNFLKCRGAN